MTAKIYVITNKHCHNCSHGLKYSLTPFTMTAKIKRQKVEKNAYFSQTMYIPVLYCLVKAASPSFEPFLCFNPVSECWQQIELQKEQHLQLRHPILQDTVQTDIVLPQDHTRLERTATGGCDSRVTGLFQVQAKLAPVNTT